MHWLIEDLSEVFRMDTLCTKILKAYFQKVSVQHKYFQNCFLPAMQEICSMSGSFEVHFLSFSCLEIIFMIFIIIIFFMIIIHHHLHRDHHYHLPHLRFWQNGFRWIPRKKWMLDSANPILNDFQNASICCWLPFSNRCHRFQPKFDPSATTSNKL